VVHLTDQVVGEGTAARVVVMKIGGHKQAHNR
jgi:hypothetical protein